ncbi:MAG: S-methyl-5'-thioadenosine phosphorylase [Victivallaceae bacterium]|nr:S-methyl-5'-thioadenosine phosphorylase [Victivallaceae bacterium]
MAKFKLGIIGGSGLYDIDGMEDVRTESIETPFGAPSDEFICGTLCGIEVVFLPRHGKNHIVLPSELNHRANIFGMKLFGVTHIISISAVGSLKEELRPRDIVIVNQYFDRTKQAAQHTFFGDGLVAHISFADPVCPELATLAVTAAEKAVTESDDTSRQVFSSGTYLNMEGPAFSTKAESMVYKSWGMDVIGMTNMAEAKLAREAEICYSTMAMVTDYDCWHPGHDNVTVELVIANLVANSALAKATIKKVAAGISGLENKCSCGSALVCALITHKAAVTAATIEKLAPIVGRYFK